jgi:CRP/FNR family transcriptional regulator, cyclic AMP receptor protein
MPSPSRMLSRQRSAPKPTNLFDPKAFLANAGTRRTLCHYSPKQVLFSQGERADAVFYIQDGTARLGVVSKHGKEATIALLGRGNFLGEGCIASDQPIRMTTATAITKCSVLKIEKREMLRTLHEEQGFSDMFVAYLVARHNRTQSDLVDQLFNSIEKRLARTLLMLTHWGKEGSSEALIPGISQQTLAEMIGTTRSHVNVFEQIQKAWLHRVQRRVESTQFPPQCCAPRIGQDRHHAGTTVILDRQQRDKGTPDGGVPF